MTVPVAAVVSEELPDLQISELRPVSGGDTGEAYGISTPTGDRYFLKYLAPGFAHLLPQEAASLRWLASQGMPIPAVRHVSERLLLLDWRDATAATPGAAAILGRDLARLHRQPAPTWGCAPPGVLEKEGYVGSLSVPYGSCQTFTEMYVELKLQPIVQRLRETRQLGAEQYEVLALCLAAIAANEDRLGIDTARIVHGDLWSGNLLWQGDRVSLIDPAAYGGHPETDLAMLALFGAPMAEAIYSAYNRENPLAQGWRERRVVHQLFPLLVHAELFGGHYVGQVTACARRTLAILT